MTSTFKREIENIKRSQTGAGNADLGTREELPPRKSLLSESKAGTGANGRGRPGRCTEEAEMLCMRASQVLSLA